LRKRPAEAATEPSHWQRWRCPFGQKILQLGESRFGAFDRIGGGIDPARARIFAGVNLAGLQQRELLLDASVLLLAPRYEAIGGGHDARFSADSG
jgi:hypothetical protein